MSNHENACISQEEIDRTARINMEVCATFVARMIQKYGHEVLAEIEEMKAKENTNEQCTNHDDDYYLKDGSDKRRI